MRGTVAHVLGDQCIGVCVHQGPRMQTSSVTSTGPVALGATDFLLMLTA